MNLNVTEWKPFITSRLFPIMENGKANQQMLDEGDECFYVGAKKDDNGVMLHCLRNDALITKGNCIVFICNGQGSVGFANYMDVDFIGTTDIVAGYNKHLNKLTGTFLATIYSQERPKYSFGRKWKTHLKDTEIKLPIKHNADGTVYYDSERKYSDSGYIPDWDYMENYIKSLHYKQITTRNNPLSYDLNVEKWKEFNFGELITSIYKAKAINKGDLNIEYDTSNEIRYITRTAENNGCELLVNKNSVDYNSIEQGNAITIGDTTATCFYQENEFITGDHMVVVRAPWLNKYTGLFIVALLNTEQYKYSYGRAFLMDRIKDTIIKLPVDSKGNPDWRFMEKYITALPYGDRI
ncbi:MAG: restriction endonuclease subunit S [Eubacterium sp.]|nr:restriction endonuclease subunit S [Eubacterium sp.]